MKSSVNSNTGKAYTLTNTFSLSDIFLLEKKRFLFRKVVVVPTFVLARDKLFVRFVLNNVFRTISSGDLLFLPQSTHRHCQGSDLENSQVLDFLEMTQYFSDKVFCLKDF